MSQNPTIRIHYIDLPGETTFPVTGFLNKVVLRNARHVIAFIKLKDNEVYTLVSEDDMVYCDSGCLDESKNKKIHLGHNTAFKFKDGTRLMLRFRRHANKKISVFDSKNQLIFQALPKDLDAQGYSDDPKEKINPIFIVMEKNNIKDFINKPFYFPVKPGSMCYHNPFSGKTLPYPPIGQHDDPILFARQSKELKKNSPSDVLIQNSDTGKYETVAQIQARMGSAAVVDPPKPKLLQLPELPTYDPQVVLVLGVSETQLAKLYPSEQQRKTVLDLATLNRAPLNQKTKHEDNWLLEVLKYNLIPAGQTVDSMKFSQTAVSYLLDNRALLKEAVEKGIVYKQQAGALHFAFNTQLVQEIRQTTRIFISHRNGVTSLVMSVEKSSILKYVLTQKTIWQAAAPASFAISAGFAAGAGSLKSAHAAGKAASLGSFKGLGLAFFVLGMALKTAEWFEGFKNNQKDFADLLAMLTIETGKVVTSAYIASMITAAICSFPKVAVGLASLNTYLAAGVVIVGAIFITFLVGVALDKMDEGLGVTDRVAQYMRTVGEYILPDNTTDLKTLMNSYCQ
jgi:hypothetical protein